MSVPSTCRRVDSRGIRAAVAAFAILALFTAATANAWGELGHQLVAELAQRRLTPAADRQVRQLLQGEPQPSLAGIAMWADNLRTLDPDRFKATSKWHYVNIARGTCHYVAARDCPDGACVVQAIETQRRLMVDSSQPLDVRRDALKFVVHLVGDVNQPMHATNHDDHGGNGFHITLHTDILPEAYARDRYKDGIMDTNLHSVWDYFVLASARLELMAYADQLAKTRPAKAHGTPAKWAAESCKLAEKIYAAPHEIGAPYLLDMRPLAEKRVELAAGRLARMLNDAFPP